MSSRLGVAEVGESPMGLISFPTLMRSTGQLPSAAHRGGGIFSRAEPLSSNPACRHLLTVTNRDGYDTKP
jgi:hypothetical protein